MANAGNSGLTFWAPNVSGLRKETLEAAAAPFIVLPLHGH